MKEIKLKRSSLLLRTYRFVWSKTSTPDTTCEALGYILLGTFMFLGIVVVALLCILAYWHEAKAIWFEGQPMGGGFLFANCVIGLLALFILIDWLKPKVCRKIVLED